LHRTTTVYPRSASMKSDRLSAARSADEIRARG
jgi:hypothetical protein